MPVDRFFVDKPFHDVITLEGEEFQHLSRVLRKKPGEVVELINGRGELGVGPITEMTKHSAEIVLETVHKEEKPKKHIILIQALPRINRLDTIIEKATELGCTDITLFPGEHSERKELSPAQMERIHKITIAALKQSGRLYLPQIKFTGLESIFMEGSLFFGDTDKNAPLLIHSLGNENTIAIVIGPEGGLSSHEEEFLRKRGAKGVKLSDAILRTDTAPIVALGIIAHVSLV